jgi:hypothetical protein
VAGGSEDSNCGEGKGAVLVRHTSRTYIYADVRVTSHSYLNMTLATSSIKAPNAVKNAHGMGLHTQTRLISAQRSAMPIFPSARNIDASGSQFYDVAGNVININAGA